jgi:RNA-directed DNA polymerase
MNNSDSLMNLDRGDEVWRDDRKPALDNLMMRILERDNVKRAWERVKSNQGISQKPVGMCSRKVRTCKIR